MSISYKDSGVDKEEGYKSVEKCKGKRYKSESCRTSACLTILESSMGIDKWTAVVYNYRVEEEVIRFSPCMRWCTGYL